MATNPEYVRLADYMVNGMHQDPTTGWSISGMDVKRFPEEKPEQRAVRRLLNQGVLEAASAAEFEEAHPEEFEEPDEREADAKAFVDAVKAASGKQPVQEHKLRAKESARAARVIAARVRAKLEENGIDPDELEGLDAESLAGFEENERRKALVEEIEDEDLDSDDFEEQQERTATRPPTKKAPAAKKAAKKRASSSS